MYTHRVQDGIYDVEISLPITVR